MISFKFDISKFVFNILQLIKCCSNSLKEKALISGMPINIRIFSIASFG